MPENLFDTPARQEEVVKYGQDKTHPEGKPYSTKQQAANQAHQGRERLYHKTQGSRIFGPNDDIPEGWRDTPFTNHNSPDNAPVEEPAAGSTAEAELDLLREEARKLGITVHPRTGIVKLRQLVAKHGDG